MRWSRTITVVDCHAEGESAQVVVGGVNVPGIGQLIADIAYGPESG